MHPCLERKWVHLILSFNLLSTLVAKLIIETQNTKFLSSLVFINFILVSLATVDYWNKKRIQEINSMLDKNACSNSIHFS